MSWICKAQVNNGTDHVHICDEVNYDDDIRCGSCGEDKPLAPAYTSLLPGASAPTKEVVNHPAHYNEHPSGVECIVIVEAFNFNIGNAIKYLWRAGLKGELLEDLKKAAWYINREIERVERAKKARP